MAAHIGGRLLASLSLLALCVTAAPVRAQSVEPPPSPKDRPRPDYDPVGGRLGSFFLYPKLDVDLELNDNIFASRTDRAADLIVRARPAINVRTIGQRTRLSAEAYLSQSIFVSHGSENALEGGGRAEGTVDVTRNSGLRATVSFDALAQERFNIASPTAAAERGRYRRLTGLVSYSHDLDPLRLRSELRVNRLDFSDVRSRAGTVLDQDFRDAFYVGAFVSADYRVSPGIAALARVTVDRLNLRNPSVSTGFDRDSTGLKLEGGVSLELSRLLFGEARLGYLRRNNDDPRFGTVTGLSFGAGLTWAATPLTTVRLFADRSVEEGGLEITAGNLRSSVQVSVEHELLRSLVLEGTGRYAKINPVGLAGSAAEYELEASGTYYVSRRLRLFASLRHFRRQSTGFFSEFTQNRAVAGLRLVF